MAQEIRKDNEELNEESIKWTRCLLTLMNFLLLLFQINRRNELRGLDFIPAAVAPSNLCSVILFTRGKVLLDHWAN